MSSNAKIFARNYGNYEISSIMDPEMLKDGTLPFNSNMADFSITNNGKVFACTIPKVPEDTLLKIKPAELALQNKQLFQDLQIEGKDLGRFSVVNGVLSFEYSQVLVGKQMLNALNTSAWVEISLKFVK